MLRGCDEKDFMSARVGARFIFFGFLAFVLGKRKKKAKSRKEKKNRGDKVLKT